MTWYNYLIHLFTSLCFFSFAYKSLGSTNPIKSSYKEMTETPKILQGELLENKNSLHSKGLKNPYSLNIISEGKILKNQISKNQKEIYPYIPYTEFGFLYSKTKNLEFFVNIAATSDKNEWEMGLSEINLSYKFKNFPLNVTAGLFPLPLGYMDQNSNVFAQDLSLYGSLVQNPEDIGLLSEIYLWEEKLTLQLSVFGGFSSKDFENVYKYPKSNPFVVSLKSHGSFWDVFISWFEKNKTFFDPLEALGMGFQFDHFYKKLKGSLRFEFWQILEENQTSLEYYISPSISLYKFRLGMVFGNTNRFFPQFRNAQAQSSIYENVFQLAYEIHPHITLIGERFVSQQRGGPMINDLWAARIKVDLDWSNF